MDYYEEFGVDRSAAVAEIRQAYKRLVKLLHPDHCRDEAVRRLADLQMKRLNGILKTLTDPLERAGYDLILARPPQPPQLPDRRLARPPLWFSVSAATVVLAGLILLGRTPKPTLGAIAPIREPLATETLETSAVSASSHAFGAAPSRVRAPSVPPEHSPAEPLPALSS